APGVFDELEGISTVGSVNVDSITIAGFALNLDPAKKGSKVFSSKTVRQALLRGIDREGMASAVVFRYATVEETLFASNSWAYNEPRTNYSYDPKNAAAMLDADGWKAGATGTREKDGVPLKFEIVAPTGTPEIPAMAAVIQQNLKQIGADVTVR